MHPNGVGVRIKATITDIISYDIRHIKVDTEPTFYGAYTIILDDNQFQAERYALHIMEELNLINFLFPSMTPEPSAIAISANIQKLDSKLKRRIWIHLIIYCLQFEIF